MAEQKTRPSLDQPPPGPPEMQTRPAMSGIVAARDASQGGAMPGMGGPNAIGSKAMAAEQALGDLAQVLPDPAPIAEIVARLRAAVVQALQSSGGAPPSAGPTGMTGIVAPPAPISPPAMGGAGMPPPPLQ